MTLDLRKMVVLTGGKQSVEHAIGSARIFHKGSASAVRLRSGSIFER
jgi:hypothetical protein